MEVRDSDILYTISRCYDRWVFYTCILGYGINCLWDKAWLWNIRFCWYNYPFHQVQFLLISNKPLVLIISKIYRWTMISGGTIC